MTYHLARDGQQLGTFTESELNQKFSAGQVLGTDLCWTEGMANWQPLSSVINGGAASVAPMNPYMAPRVDVSRQASFSSGVELASRGNRLVAQILDMLVGIGIAIPFFFSAITIDQTTGEFTSAGIIGFSISCILFLALLGYTIYLLSTQGQTLGKKWMGVRIVNYSDNGSAGFVKAVLLRLLVNGIIGVIPFYGLIDILFIFSDDKRCLHDKIAGTHVVKA
ncbi:MAG: RDD family protein [Verrucomicrobia bacterium]|nr:RDD family protein [Verrucomicrobiota bacterium]